MEQIIDITELWKVFKEKWYVIFLMTLFGLGISAAVTFFVITPEYTATTQLLVSRQQEEDQMVELGEIQTNIQLINTYRDIIYDPVVMDRVVAQLNSTLTADDLQEKVDILVKEDSQIFGVQITDSDADRAANIANLVASTFKENVNNIVSVENVAILSRAKANPEPVSPRASLNLALGTVGGMIIGMVASIMWYAVDNKVRDEDIITDELGWVNLGTVTEMPKDIWIETEEASSSVGDTQAVDYERTRTRLGELKGL